MSWNWEEAMQPLVDEELRAQAAEDAEQEKLFGPLMPCQLCGIYHREREEHSFDKFMAQHSEEAY